MSSATRYESRAGHNLSMSMASSMGIMSPTYHDQMDRIGRLGLSPRQRELNRLWCYYTCNQYSSRRIDWDGNNVVGAQEHEVIASAGYIPSGFYDAGAKTLPLKFRKPTSPYHLCRVIVNRFTGLLFSEKKHPKIQCMGDPDTEDYINALADSGRLWPAMIQARAFGGAMGSVAIGFQFVDGKLRFEVHDPRWINPFWEDRSALKLKAIEKRYIFPVEVIDPDNGQWVEVPMWYRRIVDGKSDVIFKPVPVEDGKEPTWIEEKRIDHNFGFCPVVWVQNMPISDDIDGDPDCHGVYEQVEAMDSMNASAHRATIANCDPTVVLSTDAAMDELQKGHNKALKLPSGSSASYMEHNGSGPAAAERMADRYRKQILEVAQCYLEEEGNVPSTATEVERRYSSMIAKADILREQYGENGVKPLLNMVIKAVRNLGEPKIIDGNIIKHEIVVPPKVVKNEKGTVDLVERKLGPGPHRCSLKWPRYFELGHQETANAVGAAANAKAAGLVDDEHATKFIAEFFGVDDVGQMVQQMKEQQKQQQAELEQLAMGMGDSAAE